MPASPSKITAAGSATHLRSVRSLPVYRGQQRTARPEAAYFFPYVSIPSILVGTMAAVSMVPFNPQKAGSVRASAIAMSLGILAGPLAAALVNLRNLLRTENIVSLSFIYWMLMDLVLGSYDMPGIGPEVVRKSFIVLGVFLMCYWFGTTGKPWSFSRSFLKSCTIKPELNVIMPIMILCFSLAMLKYLIPCRFDVLLVIKYLGANRWAAPWARGKEGGWDAFLDHVTYFGYLLPTLAVLVARKKGWLNLSTLFGLLMALIFVICLSQSGSRRIIGLCFGSALLYWVLDRQKVKIFQLAVAGVVVAGILFVMQAMLVFRTTGMSEVGLENTRIIAYKSMMGSETAGGVPKSLHVDDNFYRLSQILTIVPGKHPYVYHKQIYYVLVRPIPRILWPGKPENAGFDLQALLGSGASLTATVLAEYWISFGFVAVVIGGWITGKFSRLSAPLFDSSGGTIGPVFYGYITMGLFASTRSLVDAILYSYVLLAWIAVNWMIEKYKN